MKNIVHNMDCMEYMKDLPDNAFDLAIVDPPYGIGAAGGTGGNNLGEAKKYKNNKWDNAIPDKQYFNEIYRVSKNQIIWGANYFTEYLPGKMGWIFWNKKASGNFSDGELAYTSFDRALKLFEFEWCGMRQGNMKNKELRIHATQKPVALYKWLLKNYAKPGDTILDTHIGSGSIRIACHDLGFALVGCELDKDYWEAQEQRFNRHIQQQDLFTGEDLQELIFTNSNISPDK